MDCKRYPIGDQIVDLGIYSCWGCLRRKTDDMDDKIEFATGHRQYFSWGYQIRDYRCAFIKD